MILLGLTGGVGMGKSTAARFFEQHGARVVDTDKIARDLVQPGQSALAEIRSAFGNEIIDANGQLRRDDLAKIVFGAASARKKLEEILHPRIRERWLGRVESWRNENCALGLVMIPLLYETHAAGQFDKVICVACSEKSRGERLLARGWAAGQIKARIAAQMPVAEKIARADFVIWSEGVMENHARQVNCVLKCLKSR